MSFAPHKPSAALTVRLARAASFFLLLTAAIFYALHFLHLDADFPNNSPWMDWSKYTDEGWYGDAAIRHFRTGHWYWPGDFNPAVALPVWPVLEWIVFHFTGVSTYAARGLTLVVFGLTLLTLYKLLQRFSSASAPAPGSRTTVPPLAGPLCIAFLCLSPYIYVFERMAILEPLLVLLTALALLVASNLREIPGGLRRSRLRRANSTGRLRSHAAVAESSQSPKHLGRERRNDIYAAIGSTLALGLLLPAMVLTKTTAVALFPAVFYMVWARAGYRFRPFLRLLLSPVALGTLLWAAYFFGLVHRHGFLEDYRYLFSANAYNGFGLMSLSTIVINTVADGTWMGRTLYVSFFVLLALALFWRPRVWIHPANLLPSLLLWAAGYFAFIGYHTNLQPRYYLVIAVPLTAAVALLLDELPREPHHFVILSEAQSAHPKDLRSARGPQVAIASKPSNAPSSRTRRFNLLAATAAAALTLAIVIPDALQQLDFVRHPTYEFRAAAENVARIVRADKSQSPLVLSISGSDLTLMTGLATINDDYGTLDLDKRVAQYHPGWYAAWNELDDDKADALSTLYQPVRVAAFPALDDPDRNLLILYRLDPKTSPARKHRNPRPTPKQLQTKLGQQPTTTQLLH